MQLIERKNNMTLSEKLSGIIFIQLLMLGGDQAGLLAAANPDPGNTQRDYVEEIGSRWKAYTALGDDDVDEFAEKLRGDGFECERIFTDEATEE
jgi:hypothetical protein